MDKEKLALVGIDLQGTQQVVPCTVDCFKSAAGVNARGVAVEAPAHLRPENIRFLLRLGADKKAFRVDQIVEYDLTKLDKTDAPSHFEVRVSSDNYGTLTMKDVPHNTRLEDAISILNYLSTLPEINTGDTHGPCQVVSVEGDLVKVKLMQSESGEVPAKRAATTL